jgi:hypothetical protein
MLHLKKTVGNLSGVIILSAIAGCAREAQITEVNKVPVSVADKVRVARKQVAPPKTFNELPFIETNVQPELTAAEKVRGYLLFKRPITEPVYQNTIPAWYERLDQLQAFAAQGEIETLTFSIYPQRALQKLRVTASSLKQVGGKGVLKGLDVRLCTYWYMRYPGYTSQKTMRRNPEFMEKVDFHSSPAKECQRYWLTLKVPTDAAPGIYTGTVRLQDEGYGKAVVIPVQFRVLDFKLLRDPNKFYSTYHYDLHNKREFAQPEKQEWLKQAAEKDYRSMMDYGVDMFPVLRPEYDRKTGKIFIRHFETKLKRMRAAGLSGPIPLACGRVFTNLYAQLVMKSNKVKYYPHWKIPKMPGASFYKVVEQKFRDFNRESKAKGYPELVYCPLDEVDASAGKFGTKIYKALMDSGCKIYITKNPMAPDAAVYKPNVHVFCSQGFSIKYEDTQKAKHEYWSYPNHVSGERKDRAINCRGGRMTYGYGFWRSGYTSLIPWIWRWDFRPMFVYDFLKHKKISQCGNQIDEAGNIIPTIYWVCFREGRDDARYVYTLQTAIVQRENSTSPECKKLVKQGRALLQEVWNAINVKTKYKGDGWEDTRFGAYRWRIADLTEKLLKHKAVNHKQAPSVLVNSTSGKAAVGSAGMFSAENVSMLPLGGKDYSGWRSVTGEGKTRLLNNGGPNGASALLYTVKIDHKTDGGGEKGKYPIGWPRIALNFKKKTLDLTRYDYITMQLKVDSDRDEVADDYTFLKMNASSWVPGGERSIYETELLGAVEQRKWITANIPINNLIGNSDKKFWRNVKRMQIWLGESQYPHGAELKFYIADIKLLKLKSPVVKSLIFPEVVILPTKYLVVRPEIMGLDPSGKTYNINASIISPDGNAVTVGHTSGPAKPIVIDTGMLKAGNYRISLTVSGAKQIFTVPFKAVNGPFGK